MRSLLIVLIILISALALFASINTRTVFTGSHYITNISSSQNDINCSWCHPWVKDALNHSAVHSGFKCEECHRMQKTADGEVTEYATHNETGTYPGNQSHATYTPTCLDCHGRNGTYYNNTWKAKQAPPAPAFNKSDYGTNYSAHKSLVEDAKEQGMCFGENEGCLVCHTNYSVQIPYSYFWNINYTVSGWNITSFSDNGTRNYEAGWKKTGMKHEFCNVSKIDCTKCHKNIYDALVNGTPDSPPYLTHAPIENASDWDTDNPWGHYRYHYIPANRSERVNSSYCNECHNVEKYADNHPSANLTYDLGNVTADTNSTNVHAAEALSCQTCHGSGKAKEVIDNPDENGTGHADTDFVDYVRENYARNFQGDICMGCHEAAVHPSSQCSRCHDEGNASISIESEPSGNATNTW